MLDHLVVLTGTNNQHSSLFSTAVCSVCFYIHRASFTGVTQQHPRCAEKSLNTAFFFFGRNVSE